MPSRIPSLSGPLPLPLVLGLAAALTLPLPHPAAAQRLDPAAFDAYVAQAVRDWRAPGLAIAVVQGDSVVFARGYGVRRAGTRDSVGVHTLFANASTTKAFTAMVVAMLADEGKLSLDDRVFTRDPEFVLADPYVTRELSIRDLLTHRSGLPEASFAWYAQPGDFRAVAHRLRFLKATSSLRERFAYQNETYAEAGFIAARVAGASWDALVHDRILAPLGMRETYTNTTDAARQADVAYPHFRLHDSLVTVRRYETDNIGPAGAMYSSVSDMARWMRFLLDSGRVGGRALVSRERFAELLTPQQLVPPDEFYPTARLTRPHFTAYGLGWFLHDYRGEMVAFHTGSIDGFSAIVALVPDRRAGVVVFVNADHAELRHALMYRAIDALIGAPPRDWSGELRTLYAGLAARRDSARARAEGARVPGTHPSLPLSAYTGTYGDSLLGVTQVRLERGGLVVEASPLLVGDLEHWNYDTFRVRWRDAWLGTDLWTFRLGPDGKVRALLLGRDGELVRR